MRYGKAGQEQHGQKAGSVLMVAFELDGRPFTALNGGPAAQVCGWLMDKYGLSWQIVPERQLELIGNPKSARSQRAFAEMMRQKKPDIAAVQKAYDG